MTSEVDRWNAWVKHLSTTSGSTSVTVGNIEKALKEYYQLNRRMLWINTLLLLGVLGLNGLLLFYK
tara:strand:+ start:98 stop:295 length:198 start_codon:yes stop_codon:yes gene_type:complete